MSEEILGCTGEELDIITKRLQQLVHEKWEERKEFVLRRRQKCF
jgi:hypothetical protein